MTVRRLSYLRADFVHALLRHLEAVGFEGRRAPWATTTRGARC